MDLSLKNDLIFHYIHFVFKKKYLFMAVLGPPCCVQVISSCREQGLVFVVCKPLIVVASLIAEHGLSSYGLVAPQHVGSSHIRDRTHIFCIGQRILNHWLHSASIIAYGIAHFLLTM